MGLHVLEGGKSGSGESHEHNIPEKTDLDLDWAFEKLYGMTITGIAMPDGSI